jgi:penicillin-binding protein A
MMKRLCSLYIRYLGIPFAVIFFFLIVFPEFRGEAEVVKSHSRQPVVSRNSLQIITPQVIKDKNLTINWNLQEYIAAASKKARTGFVTVAVLNPRNGEILALYGKDSSGENDSLCLNAYLAASLFKVVTATAAIDYAGMSVGSTCTYTGNAHTLYKSQISAKESKRWATEVTLARAFASSNNVIFGKIGAMHLGEAPLLLTAMRLGFWKAPVVDCQSTPSTVFIPESQFNLAELASGYNRYTKVSPVHAAQMVSAVLNEGTMVRPKILKGSDTASEQVMCKGTADNLRAMMCQTVKNGTVSRAFNNSRNDRVLKDLIIGGKSGSINGVEPEGRRNWFMGFAENASTGESITIGCLVIRDGSHWPEAHDLAKNIIRHYFSEPTMVAENISERRNVR